MLCKMQEQKYHPRSSIEKSAICYQKSVANAVTPLEKIYLRMTFSCNQGKSKLITCITLEFSKSHF